MKKNTKVKSNVYAGKLICIIFKYNQLLQYLKLNKYMQHRIIVVNIFLRYSLVTLNNLSRVAAKTYDHVMNLWKRGSCTFLYYKTLYGTLKLAICHLRKVQIFKYLFSSKQQCINIFVSSIQ